jgi:ATP-dependent helicase HrpB
MSNSAPLPIDQVLPGLRDALRGRRSAILSAPPGAGKTTRVPLALLAEPWLAGRKIILLEPRRLAARAAARRMATTMGESAGQTVGYRMRLETKIGAATKIEVVTEGILTRLLQQDPALSDYALVIFDEFHERHLPADVGLALCLEAQRLFRPELRLLIMSATLDTDRLSTLLDQPAVLRCEGRQFPVETRYLEAPRTGRLEDTVVDTTRHLVAKESGSLLVFLPGMAEIRRVERRLRECPLPASVIIAPLHGELPQAQQDEAIRPSPPGMRKIVLATSIAETSLTIEGIRIVIDSGLMRVPRFDPDRGLSRLDTIRVTQDSAEQRRGRAGRLEPGLCYRLWTAAEQQGLLPRRTPEIVEADLTGLRLDLAHWGVDDPNSLTWLDPPPAQALNHAEELLASLGALDRQHRVTPHGRKMAGLPLHPRLAHMIVTAIPLGFGPVACQVAALLSERDLIRSHSGRPSPDFRLRVDVLHREHTSPEAQGVDRGTLRRVHELTATWLKSFSLSSAGKAPTESIGLLLGLAYPDRIAQRLPGPERRYRLANGQGVAFPEPHALAQEPWLAVAELQDADQWARITLAAPVTLAQLEQHCAAQIEDDDHIRWDAASQTVSARRQRRLGAVVLAERGLPAPDPEQVTAALLAGIREAGLATLAWTPELLQWRARVTLLRRLCGSEAGWPDVSDAGLAGSLRTWLTPSIGGLTSLAQVARIDLAPALDHILTWKQRQELDRLAPTHLTVPTGSRIRLDYRSGDQPVLAVKLQEMFGCRETPRVADGRLPVVIHLLSPAGRPVQVTQDLARFWSSSYFEVRKELRGRYPKHPWPDDPLTALPTKRAKSRREAGR